MTTRPLYRELAALVEARQNCIKSGNDEWRDRHEQRLNDLVRSFMPSGSGIDSGTYLYVDASDSNRLVFTADYHHMNENGMYDGWTEHTVIVTTSLAHVIDIRVTGKNRNDIKEYLAEMFQDALMTEIEIN